MNDQSDSRSPGERLLDMALAARKQPLAQRRRTVTALMRIALGWEEAISLPSGSNLRAPQAPLCSESKIFEKAYGDECGGEYWHAWLEARDNSDKDIAELLARHLAHEKLPEVTGNGGLANSRRLSILGLTQQECARALAMIPPGALRGRLLQLFEDPNTRHLIPASLRAVLVPAAKTATPSEAAEQWPQLQVVAAPQRKRGGRPSAADWPALEVVLNEEIDLVGLPHLDGAPGWRTQADVIKWLEPRLGKDGPETTALKDNVRAMLQRARARRGGN